MSTKSYQARETIKAERKAGTLINGAGNRTSECCVFLDNGSVIASPYTVSQIMRLIRKANSRAAKNGGVWSTGRVKVAEDKVIPNDEDLELVEDTCEIDETYEDTNLDIDGEKP